tara:strand:+ start:449 stop:667 length:219 start_codon:yes stop_codon:yes gene_type:complete
MIRKVSIGTDYKTAMHYVLGQDVLGGNYKIHLIQVDDKSSSTKIWIEAKGEVLLWKEFASSMPISIEYNINF